MTKKLNRSDWIEVIAQEEAEIVVPEWTTLRLHTGQRLKLPPAFVKSHSYLFGLDAKVLDSKESYVENVLGVKKPPRKG